MRAFGVRAHAAQAEDAYPTRPIHIVIPFPAGGPSDIAARIIAEKMNEDWGQPVIVDNRPGANTIIGAETVAKATPDGYTLLMAIDSTLVMNQYLYKTLPYDPLNDFAPITTTVKSMSLLCVAAETGPKSVAELIARGKGRARQARLRRRHHRRATRRPVLQQGGRHRRGLCAVQRHRGDGAGPADRFGRHGLRRDRGGGPADRKRQGARAGKLDGRKEPYPDVPTLAAAGSLQNIRGYFPSGSAWSRPRRRLKPIIDKLNREIVHILSEPDVREKFNQTGNFAVTSTPEEFAAFIRNEAARWEKVMQEAGIRYD